MTFDEILARIEWFIQEKDRLQQAAYAIATMGGDIRTIHIQLDESPNILGDFAPLTDALNKALFAVLDAPESLRKGKEVLDGLSSAIAHTGKSYLLTEAANSGELARVNQAIESEGL